MTDFFLSEKRIIIPTDGAKLLGQFSVRCEQHIFYFYVFHAPTIIAKLLKLRDPSEGFTSISKLVFEIKICSMYKIISLSFIPGVNAYLYVKRWSQT
jgi:hypothetical protein